MGVRYDIKLIWKSLLKLIFLFFRWNSRRIARKDVILEASLASVIFNLDQDKLDLENVVGYYIEMGIE